LWVDQFDVDVHKTDEYHRNLKANPANLKIDIILKSHDSQLLDDSSEVASTRKNNDDIKEAQDLADGEHLIDSYWTVLLEFLFVRVDEDMWLVDKLL
jgi:hypothetical protein